MITLMGTRCEIKCNLHTVQATRQKPRCCESRTISMRHSTERACMVILVMLDLSSAFDTIEHDVLLTRLEHTFGISVRITDKALAWLRSYLSERHQNVVVDSTICRRTMFCNAASHKGQCLLQYYTACMQDLSAILSTTAMQTIYKSMQPSEEVSVLRPHC